MNIINAAPRAILQGIQDLSGRPPVIDPEVVPSHLPHIYLYAEKGDTLPQLVSGDSFTAMFGAKTMDPRGPYYNHQSVLANTIQGEGNAMMVQRVIPSDAGPKARLLLSLDIVAEPALPQWQRNADGTFLRDVNGAKIAVAGGGATAAGYKAKWVINEWIGTDDEPEDFGEVTTKVGTLVNSTSAQSQRYPIMELEANFVGAYGNNLGLRLSAPTTISQAALNDSLAEAIKSYLYRFQFVARPDSVSSAVVQETTSGEQFADLSMGLTAINPVNDQVVSIEDQLISLFQDVDTPGYPKQYGPFGKLHVYRSNLTTILAMIGLLEAPKGLLSTMTIPNASAANLYEVNPFTATNYHGAPYHTLDLAGPSDGGILFSDNTTLYASGGSDGTMSDTAFDLLVRGELLAYGSGEADLLDWAMYPQSCIYDTGFKLPTKLAMLTPIGKRKDMYVVLSTQDVTAAQNTASEESSIAISLRAAARNFPESEIYGTGVCRAVVIGHSGFLINHPYKGLLPLTIEFAQKSARFMGAGNGVWRTGLGFDESPQNHIRLFRGVNATFKSATARNKDWDTGLVWAQNYDRRSLFWPAVQTVYDDDSSILNGAITMMCAVELEKVVQKSWRDLTGNSKLTNDQFIARSNELIAAMAPASRFDQRFTIIPQTYYTKPDVARGYSWSCKVHLYGPNMKSVGSYTITANRISDLNQSA